MQVMILEEDPTLRTAVAAALVPEGFDILSFGRLAPAKEAARQTALDLLVLGESVEGRLAHDVALLAEWRSPGLGAILLSDRQGEGVDDLFDLIPSLQAVLGRRTGARTLAQVALSAARSQAVRPRLAGADPAEDKAQTTEDLTAFPTPPAPDADGAGPASPPSSPAAPPVAPSAATPVATVTEPAAPPAPSPAKIADKPGRLTLVPLTTDAPPAAPGPVLTTANPADTRRLLSELGRRYARMMEEAATPLAFPAAAAVPDAEAAARAGLPCCPTRPDPMAEPDPTPPIQRIAAARPIAAAVASPTARRLHLA